MQEEEEIDGGDIDGDDDNHDDDDGFDRYENGARLPKVTAEDFPYRYELNRWYFDNYPSMKDVSSSKLKQAYATCLVRNPTVASFDNSLDPPDLIHAVTQLFTASFTCPLTGQKVEAGKLPGFMRLHDDDRYYYRKKAVADQAAAKAALKEWAQRTDEDLQQSPLTNGNGRNTPRSQLQLLYAQKFGIPIETNRHYILTTFPFAGGKTATGFPWWKASFTCPLTGRVFESTTLPTDDETAKPPVKFDDNIVWYSKKSDALHAVAGEVLAAIEKEGVEAYQQSSGEPPDERSEDTLLEPLASWYRNSHRSGDNREEVTISVDNDMIVTVSDIHGQEGPWWTATFVCPLSGERFDAGTLYQRDRHSDEEKVNWYRDEDTAIEAAALFAYDAMRYRETGQMDPRFCQEDPSQLTAPLSAPPIFDGTVDPTPDFDVGLELEGINDDGSKIEYIHDDADHDDNNDDEAMGEDEYVLEVIPQRLASTTLGGPLDSKYWNTLDVIAQTWIESTGGRTIQTGSEGDTPDGGHHDAQKSREMAISRAKDWILSHQNDQSQERYAGDHARFDVAGQMGSLKIANLILSSLASAHQRIPFESTPVGIEEVAKAVLDNMRSKSNSSMPDANSYAFFLKCLEGETPAGVAERARQIVDRMTRGAELDGVTLPSPNAAVYDSLSQLHAQAGLRASSELVMGLKGLDQRREAFLTDLSSMAYDPGAFDVSVALTIIDQMKALSLNVNVEVYNAPLRWAGVKMGSRTYARAIPWDSYDKIFRGGFRPENNNDPLFKQAQKMEDWMERMKSLEVEPNLETYESVIQAWVRCGMLRGLNEAESYATKLLHGEIAVFEPVCLETFYPIIAAWAYSGSSDSSKRVEKWIKDIDDHKPMLQAHRNFQTAPFLASVTCQTQQLQWPSKDCASQCIKELEKISDLCKSSSGPIPTSDAFVLTIQAWTNVASELVKSKQANHYELNNCATRIARTVEIYNDILAWLYNSQESSHREALAHLVRHAPPIYGAQLLALRNLENEGHRIVSNRTESATWLHSSDLAFLEGRIRRLEELQVFIEDEGAGFDEEDKQRLRKSYPLPYEDSLLSFSPCLTWSHYIEATLDALEGFSNSDQAHQHADFVRLCLLVHDLLRTRPSDEKTLEMQTHAIRLLERFWANTDPEKDPLASKLIRVLKDASSTASSTASSIHRSHSEMIVASHKASNSTSKVQNNGGTSGKRRKRVRGSRGAMAQEQPRSSSLSTRRQTRRQQVA